MYGVYALGDSLNANIGSAILSASQVAPLIPYGYDMFRLIGYATTDVSGNLLLGYWSAGNDNTRSFTYDAFQATAVTAGDSTSYANVDLTKYVPLVNNLSVSVYTNYAANAAADTLSLQAGNATGAQVIITAPVVAGTAHTTTLSNVLAQTVVLSTIPSPVINYKVSSGSDAVAIDVAGYRVSL